MLVRLAGFQGRFPAVDETALPEAAATVADDCDLSDGTLRAVRKLKLVEDFQTDKPYSRVFRLRKVGTNEELLLPTTEELSDVVRSPLTEDAYFRFYRTQPSDGPNMAVATFDAIAADPETAFHPVAVPAPTAPLTAVPESTPTGADVAETRVYLCLWQTTWGEESAPSPTTTVTVKVGESVTLQDIPQPPPDAVSGRSFDTVNIYRTVVGNESAEYYFVAAVDVGTTTYTDDQPSRLVVYNRQLEAFRNETPPDDLLGLTVHHTGALCGFVGNEVYFSKPYLPHAWPTDLKLSFSHEVRGLAAVGQELFVLTDSRPAVVYGSAIDTLGIQYIPRAEPCLNKNSIVAFNNGVVYASENGLAYMEQGGVQNLTEGVIDYATWGSEFLYGKAIQGARYRTLYLGRTVGQRAFAFDVERRNGLINLTYPPDDEVAAFVEDVHSHNVFVLIGDSVYEWDAAFQPAGVFTWRSKTMVLPKPVSFGAFQVHYRDDVVVPGERSFLEVRIWGDDRLAFDGPVRGSGDVHRLLSGWKADHWRLQLRGNVIVTRVVMGETPRELAGA